MRRFNLLGLLLACALLLQPFSTSDAQLSSNRTTASVATKTNAPLPAAEVEAAKEVTAERLSEYLHVVASDAMEGRDTPSRGLDATAKYIVDHISKWGIKPAGDDGTYFQHIKLRRNKVDASKTTAELNTRQFKFGEDFLPGQVSGAASGALVYVGHGWVVKSKNIDAYNGIDVRDKIMIVSGGLGFPAGVRQSDLKGKPGDDWQNPAYYAQTHGAKGMIYIPRAREIERWAGRLAATQRGFYEVVRFAELNDAAPSQLPYITASASMLDALFEGETHTGAELLKHAADGDPFAAFTLSPQKIVKFNVQLATETAETQNVVGVLEGKDPLRKKEFVALGAHYDHIGIGLPVNGDSINNGADDDGSGTVSVLNIAQALAHGPRPARSILFVWHCGEEKGLWGSRYFTEYPTVPLNQVVAQLNIDMIGRSRKEGDTNPLNKELSGPNEIYVIGSKMMSSELGDLSERVNSAYLHLAFNYRYDDPSDPNRFFFRSDHFNYAHKGIPIIFYFDGVHEDYHRPSDSVDKIDFQKMEKVARTVLITAEELANAPARPRIDKQLPPELSTR